MKKIIVTCVTICLVAAQLMKVQAATVTEVTEVWALMRKVGTSYQLEQVPLIWNNISNGKFKMSVDGTKYMTSTEAKYAVNLSHIKARINMSYDKWDSSGLTSTMISESSKNVYFSYCTPTFWTSLLGADAEITAAYTVAYDTNKKIILNESDAYSSTKRISSAIIYFNPDEIYNTSKLDLLDKRIVHELGHVLCLGHPRIYTTDSTSKDVFVEVNTKVNSVMHQEYNKSYISNLPTNYDIGLVRKKLNKRLTE